MTDAELDRVAARAQDLVLFADGVEDAGLVALARKTRVAADDLARVVAELRTERAVRVRAQELHRECLRRLGERAATALKSAVR